MFDLLLVLLSSVLGGLVVCLGSRAIDRRREDVAFSRSLVDAEAADGRGDYYATPHVRHRAGGGHHLREGSGVARGA